MMTAMLEVRPILSALRRHRASAVLIAVQVCVTLAFLCNALLVIQQRLAQSLSPSGVGDETDVFVLPNQWVSPAADDSARVQEDLHVLRSLPEIISATVTYNYPFEGHGATLGVTLHPQNPRSAIAAALYFADEQALKTLGLKLIAGRNFRAEEIVDIHALGDRRAASGIIITRSLARALAPDGQVLGRPLAVGPLTTAPVVGVVERLQSPYAATIVNAPGRPGRRAEDSLLLPYRYAGATGAYVVRARAGELAAAMKSAEDALLRLNRQRVLEPPRSIAQLRSQAYLSSRGLAALLASICAILVGVLASGIAGLASYWVSQRQRQIGIRRALGASRISVVRYFQLENLLIVASGAVLGVMLGLAANLWMVKHLVMTRLSPEFLGAGTIIVVLLGQLAVLWPALRAASVPPAVAARSL